MFDDPPRLDPATVRAAIVRAMDEPAHVEQERARPRAPHSRKAIRAIGLPLMAAGQIADALSTHAALKRGASEMNPLYGKQPSLGKLLGIKAAVNLPLGWLIERMAGYKPKTAMGLALGAGGVGAAMAARNNTKGRQ